MPSPARSLLFINAAHALVHYAVLIYPTAVIAIGIEFGLSYEQLISLATGGFVAFGLLSLPAGWLADQMGRQLLLTLYFAGMGLALLAVTMASTPLGFAVTLLLLGSVAALYHPVGLPLLASRSVNYGHDLGVHGVCGNVGSSVAAVATAFLAARFGWRGAFVLPGLLALGLAVSHWYWVGHEEMPFGHGEAPRRIVEPVSRPWFALGAAFVAILCGGMTYTILTIALPKVIDERFGASLPLQWTGLLATGVLLCGALMQVSVGRLIDKAPLSVLFVCLTACQLLGLLIAAFASGPLLLVGLALTMAAIFGQIVVDDALVGRFVPQPLQGKAYGTSYCLGFGISAVAVPLISVLRQGGAGFGPLLAVTAACAGMLFISAIGFRFALGR